LDFKTTEEIAMIKPDPQDHKAVDQEYGVLTVNASINEQAYRYWLATANKLIRLVEQYEQRKRRTKARRRRRA
jgi:hypothetical protein